MTHFKVLCGCSAHSGETSTFSTCSNHRGRAAPRDMGCGASAQKYEAASLHEKHGGRPRSSSAPPLCTAATIHPNWESHRFCALGPSSPQHLRAFQELFKSPSSRSEESPCDTRATRCTCGAVLLGAELSSACATQISGLRSASEHAQSTPKTP